MSEQTKALMKQLRFISEASNAFMNQRKQRLSGQQRVLEILRMEDGLVQNYLAEVLDLRPSSLAELLKKLELSGDITRVEDDDDKRIKRVFLTEEGRRKIQDRHVTKEDGADSFFSGLNEEEQQQFSQYLSKIADGWDEELKEQTNRFVDPMDRFQAMQEMRDELMARFGGDFDNMSKEEMRQMRHEMKNEMKQRMPFFQRGHHPGGMRDRRDH